MSDLEGGMIVHDRGDNGGGGPTLVLLHGLACTADVWDGVLELVREDWPGAWVAPNLPGHGGSPLPRAPSYGQHAAAVAELVGHGARICVLGHSLGGAIGALLASGWHGVEVAGVAAFSVKLRWTAGEVAKLHDLGRAPPRRFPTAAEALERYLKVSGLIGLVDTASTIAWAGVREHDDKSWGLMADPSIYLAAGPVAGLFDAALKPPLLATGSDDPLATPEDTRARDPAATIFPGLGHSGHVQDPRAIWTWFRGLGLDKT